MPAERTVLADHPARQLLDFSQKLDLNLLDSVVNSMYHDVGSQVGRPDLDLFSLIMLRHQHDPVTL